jgi:glycosyltransferase involved in cell wall biosynthesis
MKLSIVTINFNNSFGLKKTIESVAAQNFKEFEYIVIDGASTDDSTNIIKKYADIISFFVSEKDNGIYDAMNKGIANAKGDYLLFLNSGDCLCDSSILQKTYDIMEQFPGADIYYGDMFIINDIKGHSNLPWRHPETIDLNFLKIETINHQASLISAKLFQEFGLYPLKYKMAADYWLWLTSLLHDKIFRHLGFPMVIYDLSGASSSNHSLYLQQKAEIWDSMVSKSVDRLLLENNYYRQLVTYKMIKAAIGFNKKLQALIGNK